MQLTAVKSSDSVSFYLDSQDQNSKFCQFVKDNFAVDEDSYFFENEEGEDLSVEFVSSGLNCMLEEDQNNGLRFHYHSECSEVPENISTLLQDAIHLFEKAGWYVKIDQI